MKRFLRNAIIKFDYAQQIGQDLSEKLRSVLRKCPRNIEITTKKLNLHIQYARRNLNRVSSDVS
jgi:ActR/RegA family two-component response regulator